MACGSRPVQPGAWNFCGIVMLGVTIRQNLRLGTAGCSARERLAGLGGREWRLERTREGVDAGPGRRESVERQLPWNVS